MTRCSIKCAHCDCCGPSLVRLVGRNVKIATFVLPGKYTVTMRTPLVSVTDSAFGSAADETRSQHAPANAAQSSITLAAFTPSFLNFRQYRQPKIRASIGSKSSHHE